VRSIPFVGLEDADANTEPGRMATNRIITIAIITALVLLIIGVIYSKFK
jgi:hypothetical protein